MPIGPGTYRVKTEPSGAKVRLHFTPTGVVDEAKNLKTGKVHTPKEFAADRARTAIPNPLAGLRRLMG